MTTFAEASPWIQSAEGGHTVDSGGDTWYGIARNYHQNETPWPPTPARALEILKSDYWDVCRCDLLPAAIALVVFDTAVNHGAVWAAVTLQQLLRLQTDGVIGKQTIAAATAAPNQDELRVAYLAKRAKLYSTLPSALGLIARLFRLQAFIFKLGIKGGG